MFRNYFLTAWRHLSRNKGYSALNILGLSIGMALALLIGLWVQYQYSYDRFLPGYRQVYQAHIHFVNNGIPGEMAATPIPLADALLKEVPGIKYAVHTDWLTQTHNLASGTSKVYLNGGQVGADFFRIFPYPVVEGNPSAALRETYSIVLTQSTAHSLFGNADPIGKTVRIDNEHDVIVKAVIKDLPANSSFTFNYLLPFSYYTLTQDWVRQAATRWTSNSFQTFIALQPNVTYEQIEPALKEIAKKYFAEGYKVSRNEIFAQPMADWHLYNNFEKGQQEGGLIEYVRLFSLIGVLVLLIACINFMNLATARSEQRAREVGVRKAIGSRRKDLIVQFLLESIVISCIAGVIALGLTMLALPAFNALTSCAIALPFSQPAFWAIFVAYTVFTGLLAGSRPAFYLSSFQPVKVLKGAILAGRSAAWPRKVLVVVQFSCSIALIIGTLLIYQQVQYAKDRPTGYDAHRLVAVAGSSDLNRNYTALKHELLQSGQVESVTASSSPVTQLWAWTGIKDWNGRMPDELLGMAEVDVTDDYFSTIGMKFLEGKDFSGNLAADSTCVILNEAAVKRMRFKDPVGQIIDMYSGTRVKVIGVVQDALMQSPFDSAEATFFEYSPKDASNLTLRIARTANMHAAISLMGTVFGKYNPAYPFLYTFVDTAYASKFGLEELIGRLAALFAGLAIFISCLGLFGLAAYTAERRTREIGIRKVLGATVTQLWLLLSKDFLLLVLISCVIASPLAWYFLQGWLLKYSYRITIGPGVFVIAAVMALLITVVTISFQAIRGALANPTRALHSD